MRDILAMAPIIEEEKIGFRKVEEKEILLRETAEAA